MGETTSAKIQQHVSNYQGKRRAIIIGVSDYDDKNLQALDFCRNNAEKMAEILEKLGYEIIDNCKLIGYVKYDIMREAIYNFFDNKKSGAEDTLLFYYSGHGIPTSRGNIVLASSQIDYDGPRRKGFSLHELTELIHNSAAIRIVEILDCCYSGSAKVGKGFEELSKGKGSEDAAAILGTVAIENNARMLQEQGEGKCLLAASQAAQEAYGLKEKEHSIFTYYLLEGLSPNKKSIDSNGVVTPYTLGNYIYREIMNLPQNKRPKQKPIIKTEAAGDIILAYYPELVNKSEQHSMEESWINRGLHYFENEDYTDAINSFDLALEINSKNQRVYNYKGDAFFRLGRYDEAVTCYDKALETNPNYLDVLKDKGLALERLGKDDEAIKCYNQALKIKPDYLDAENAKKMLLLKLSSNAATLPPRDIIRGSDPKNPYNDPTLPHYNPTLDKKDDSSAYSFSHDVDHWYNKGSALADLGRYEEAIKCYDKAIELGPNDTAVWNNKGNALYYLGRYESAIQCYDKVLQLNPAYSDAWHSKGNALYEMRMYEEAQRCFNRAKEINPDLAGKWYDSGKVPSSTLSQAPQSHESLSPHSQPTPAGLKSKWPIRWPNRWSIRKKETGQLQPTGRPTNDIKYSVQSGISTGMRQLPSSPQIDEQILERYPYATFPKKISVRENAILRVVVKAVSPIKTGTSDSLQEGLIDQPDISQGSSTIQVATDGKQEFEDILVNIDLQSVAENFEIKGRSHRVIHVPVSKDDSRPVFFELVAKAIGYCNIVLEFIQKGELVGNLELKTEVLSLKHVDNGTLEEQEQQQTESTGSNIRVDVQNSILYDDEFLGLIIKQSSDNSRYTYDVLIQRGTHIEELDQDNPTLIRLQHDPAVIFQRYFEVIEDTNTIPAIHDDKLRSIGKGLYREIFPKILKDFIWQHRNEIKRIHVLSNEAWIPWEIIVPFEKSDEDEFLCQRYIFSRFLFKQPIQTLYIKKAKIIGLPNTPVLREELDWITNTFASSNHLNVSCASSHSEVTEEVLKKGEYELLHFSSHGQLDDQAPMLSTISLENNQKLSPIDLLGKKSKFGERHPLVILNSCQSARQAYSITGIQSWVTNFINAGASGVVGTAWSIDEESAVKFTKALYTILSKGNVTVAEAVHKAREECRKAGDAAWLAYVYYGSPALKIKFGV